MTHNIFCLCVSVSDLRLTTRWSFSDDIFLEYFILLSFKGFLTIENEDILQSVSVVDFFRRFEFKPKELDFLKF